ncbi:MAG: anthranilate synthase component I, partial [Clostridiales Family XIII bacterium]|nr:anthranilate synthase component I [Clostridiales Family XIII bacterium]
MYRPDIETAKALAGEYGAIPVGMAIPTAGRTPADAFRALKNLSRHCFILESAEDAKRHGRYTFLGYDPGLEITCENGEMRIRNGADFRFAARDCAAHIQKILA